MLFALDEGLGVQLEQLAERAQKLGRAVQTDRGLDKGPLERLAEAAPELAVHADVDLCIDQLGHSIQMAPQREDLIDRRSDPFHQTPDLGEIGRGVEGSVHGSDDVHARGLARLARLGLGHPALLQAVLTPQPVHGTIGTLPLILVDGARQEAMDIGPFGRDTAADHLGNRAGDHHGGALGVQGGIGATHRLLGPLLAQLLLAQTGDDHRQLMRRQPVRVVQYGGHREVLAADRSVDDDLQALDGRKHVDGAPITAGAVEVVDQHE